MRDYSKETDQIHIFKWIDPLGTNKSDCIKSSLFSQRGPYEDVDGKRVKF